MREENEGGERGRRTREKNEGEERGRRKCEERNMKFGVVWLFCRLVLFILLFSNMQILFFCLVVFVHLFRVGFAIYCVVPSFELVTRALNTKIHLIIISIKGNSIALFLVFVLLIYLVTAMS
jgi:hypothetical protein